MPSRTRKPLLLILTAALTIAALTACAPSTPQAPLPPAATPAPVTVTVTPLPDPAPAPTPDPSTVTVTAPPRAIAPAPQPDSTATYFSDAEIRSDVIYAFNVSNQYWNNLFDSWAGEQQWWTPALYNGDGFYDSARGQHGPYCGSTRVDDDSAQFCEADYGYTDYGNISWDMEFWRNISQYGDAAFYMVVAHEVGHAAQARFIHDGEVEAVLDNWPGQKELQADCIAGATLGKAEQDGLLTRDPGDLTEMAQVSAHSGSYTDPSHGTPEQRAEYFQRGYSTADIEACLGNKAGSHGE